MTECLLFVKEPGLISASFKGNISNSLSFPIKQEPH